MHFWSQNFRRPKCSNDSKAPLGIRFRANSFPQCSQCLIGSGLRGIGMANTVHSFSGCRYSHAVVRPGAERRLKALGDVQASTVRSRPARAFTAPVHGVRADAERHVIPAGAARRRAQAADLIAAGFRHGAAFPASQGEGDSMWL
jgi:hypothetical protein